MSAKFEEPDEVRPVSEEELYCFLDQSRPCNSECVSYLVSTPQGVDYINQKWGHCMLLLNLYRVTKILDRASGAYLNSVADAKRAGQAPYMSVDPVTGRPL